ncbi:MAG: 50S ribosomal protein L21 [Spirochaeta sp. LUC14_002_19_P3]|nr:MAG: 50S ribosomal protein L21 [Spirochaeta sp. LUC14_002_19_P3]
MYALVEIKGKQYKVQKDCSLTVDLMKEEPGTAVEFDSVLMLAEDGKPKIGTPYVKGAVVAATVGEMVKGPKIDVIKFKRRKGYERRQGHRQKYTMLTVNDIRS